MSSESDRRALYARLEEVLGEAHAATLMTNLPPTPWDQLATKDDIRDLERRVDERLDGLGDQFRGLENHVRGLDGRLEGLEDQVRGLEHQVRGLDGRFEGLGDQVRGLENHSRGLTVLVDEVSKRLATVETRFEGLDARLGRMEHHLDVAAERFLDLHGFQLGLHKNYTVTMVSGLVAVTAIFAALLTVTSLL